jgi:hypothetical protein
MAFITVAGENQIAAKQGAAQVLNITHFVLAYIAGLGSEPANRVEAMPDAGNIKAELPVTQSGYVNTNQVVYSLVMDSSLGDYDFNWVGLKDADGVLIACTYTPTIQKRKTTGAVPGNNLTRNFLIAFSGIQATTAIAVPAETWQIDFNARLWGIDERERLSNYDIYGHEGFFGDGWKVTRQGATTTYDVAAGVGYVGGIRIANAVTQQVTVSGPPKSIWLDVSLQGDISDVSAVVDFIIDAVLHEDYTDANGFKHYVTKIADIAANGSVTDTRANAEFIDTPPLGDNDKSPVNSEWVQQTIGKVLTKSVAGNSNVTLTAVEAGHGILKFTGALTGNINVIVPVSPTRTWIVDNATTGNFTLTLKTASGSGVVCSQGKRWHLFTDGTNVLDALTVNTPAQFDNSTKMSTTEFVKRALGNYSGVVVDDTASRTLTGNDVGKRIFSNENSITFTLPPANSVDAGSVFDIYANGKTGVVIAGNGSEKIRFPNTSAPLASVELGLHDSIRVVRVSNVTADNAWYVIGGSLERKYALDFLLNPSASSGYQLLPGGLIMQFGTAVTDANGKATFTFPLAFPTKTIRGIAMYQAGARFAYITNISAGTTTSIDAYLSNTSGNAVAGATMSFLVLGH